jgi:hypothetical protein
MRRLLVAGLMTMGFVMFVGCTEPVPVRARPNRVSEGEIATTATEARAMDTPFGKYDAIFKQKVNKRWLELLKAEPLIAQKQGKVVLTFHLRFDGTITDLEVVVNGVGEQFGSMCKRAITESAPFTPWPSDMRWMVGGTYREISFSFHSP